MLKVEHIGIAVKSLSESVPLFEKLLNATCYKTESVASENVNTAFFQKAETKIELLEPASGQGAISKFIEKKGEGIHHLAFAVTDIAQSIQSFQKKGFEVINEIPKMGADNKMICFLHPKSTGSVLIELCQDA